MPDDVQPTSGQGEEGSGGLFDSYLQSVPEDARETVASYLKDASKNVEGRLQEAAEFRKTWEPLQQVEALPQYDPEELRQLLAWHQQVSSSPEAYQQWLAQEARAAGLTPAEAQELSEAEQDGELTRDEIEQLIAQQAERQLEPLQQRVEHFEQQQAVNAEADAIRQVWDELEGEHGITLSEDQKEMILDLGMAKAVDERGNELPMGDASWVKAGFDRFRAITSEGQRAFVEEKANQPQPPLATGGTGAPRPALTFKEASEQARERLRQNQS